MIDAICSLIEMEVKDQSNMRAEIKLRRQCHADYCFFTLLVLMLSIVGTHIGIK